jgi:site-specific DNA recombinase
VWDVDRLTRPPRELEDVVDLAEPHGVALASVGGEIDLATPQGRLTARIKGNVAKHESEQLARRVRAKMAQRAETGQPHGRIAYGWRREQIYNDQGRRLGCRDVLHPEQAEVIRSCAAALLAGESLRAVTADLNERGVLSLNGKPWERRRFGVCCCGSGTSGSACIRAKSWLRVTGSRSWTSTLISGWSRC